MSSTLLSGDDFASFYRDLYMKHRCWFFCSEAGEEERGEKGIADILDHRNLKHFTLLTHFAEGMSCITTWRMKGCLYMATVNTDELLRLKDDRFLMIRIEFLLTFYLLLWIGCDTRESSVCLILRFYTDGSYQVCYLRWKYKLELQSWCFVEQNHRFTFLSYDEVDLSPEPE